MDKGDLISKDDDGDLMIELWSLMMMKAMMMMMMTWPVERSSALRLRKMTGE